MRPLPRPPAVVVRTVRAARVIWHTPVRGTGARSRGVGAKQAPAWLGQPKLRLASWCEHIETRAGSSPRWATRTHGLAASDGKCPASQSSDGLTSSAPNGNRQAGQPECLAAPQRYDPQQPGARVVKLGGPLASSQRRRQPGITSRATPARFLTAVRSGRASWCRRAGGRLRRQGEAKPTTTPGPGL